MINYHINADLAEEHRADLLRQAERHRLIHETRPKNQTFIAAGTNVSWWRRLHPNHAAWLRGLSQPHPPSMRRELSRVNLTFVRAAVPLEPLRIESREFVFRYRSAEHWLHTFRSFYGPTHKAFAALDVAGQAALANDLLVLARQHNTSGTHVLRIPSEYLEVVAVTAR